MLLKPPALAEAKSKHARYGERRLRALTPAKGERRRAWPAFTFGAMISNQLPQCRLPYRTRRVTTGRNGDVGRGAFFRFLPATSTHRYALKTNPFPAGATHRK